MKSHLQLIPTGDMSREDWLTYRHKGLGASEVGTVMGLDDYTSSLELFYYKIGEVAKFDVESMAAFMGREQEDLIARMWMHWEDDQDTMIRNFRASKIVRRCQRVNAYVHNPAYPWLFVSLDRKINKHGSKGEGSLELKTISSYESDKWEAGLPPKHVTQVQTQLAVCEFDYGEMAIKEDNRRMDVLPFETHDGIIEAIVTQTKEFWDKVLEARKLVNEKYLPELQYNQRRMDEINHEIDKLAPPPDGTLAYAKYLAERFNRANLAERRGTPLERAYAIEQMELAQKIKDLQEAKIQRENFLKKEMADHQVLDFGTDGKVYWSKNSTGSRTFRNKLKRA